MCLFYLLNNFANRHRYRVNSFDHLNFLVKIVSISWLSILQLANWSKRLQWTLKNVYFSGSQPGFLEKWEGSTQKSNFNEHFWFGGTRIPIRGWEPLDFFSNSCLICGTYWWSEADVCDELLRLFISILFQVNIAVRSMGPVDEVKQTFAMDCYFRQFWTDERLQYNNTRSVSFREFLKCSEQDISFILFFYPLKRGWPTFLRSGPKYWSKMFSGPNFETKKPWWAKK